MASPVPSTPFSRKTLILGIAGAVIYGLFLRVVVEYKIWADGLAVMSVAYIVVVPLVVGFLAVRANPAPTWLYALCFPWLPILGVTFLTAVIGYEGAVCIVMALPLLLLGGSVGGVAALLITRRGRGVVGTAMALPFAIGAVEGKVPLPRDVHTVQSSIDIAATPAAVWREIVSVREIRRSELPGNPLFLRMGFPRPLSAEIDREAVGGIRKARFAGGVLFLETVTDLRPDSLLSFRIRAQTDSIPATTLDEHVTIGGPHFDVLQGTYRIERLGVDSVRLHLASELRVSTHFNWYAGRWADAVMGSIQRNILEVERMRAEGAHSQ
ncbi:MAG TPA: hypothetical protein VG712_04990 [Gemmatimonadales bacterium]|nr:hypothetical protein [Gemmatimonadales bacterium]